MRVPVGTGAMLAVRNRFLAALQGHFALKYFSLTGGRREGKNFRVRVNALPVRNRFRTESALSLASARQKLIAGRNDPANWRKEKR